PRRIAAHREQHPRHPRSNATYHNLAPDAEPPLGRRGLYRAMGGTDIPDLNLAQPRTSSSETASSNRLHRHAGPCGFSQMGGWGRRRVGERRCGVVGKRSKQRSIGERLSTNPQLTAKRVCASGEIRYAGLRGHPLRLGRSSMARPDQSARWVLRAELPEHELAVANLNHVAIDRAELHLLAVQDSGYEHAVSAPPDASLFVDDVHV